MPPLFVDLVDDAGLFPPECLPLPAAMARHRADAVSGHPVLTHRLLLPTSLIAALRAHVGPAETLRVGLIADTGLTGLQAALAEVASAPLLRLETVEITLPAADVVAAARAHTQALTAVDPMVFIEIARTPGWREALEVVAGARLGAKVRCGGTRAALFPTRHELARFVVAAVALDVPFKATAGLHRAVRYRDHATGFDHHGFLNLLVASCRAVQNATVADVEAALAVADPNALASEARAVSSAVATAARRSLVAYGSCSTSEPIADLAALDLI